MRICEKCNTKYDDSHIFCSYCGNRTVPELKTCSCGGLNEYDAKFCVYCGKSFEKKEEPIEIPPVKTGSWWKILIAFGVAFIGLTAVCLII